MRVFKINHKKYIVKESTYNKIKVGGVNDSSYIFKGDQHDGLIIDYQLVNTCEFLNQKILDSDCKSVTLINCDFETNDGKIDNLTKTCPGTFEILKIMNDFDLIYGDNNLWDWLVLFKKSFGFKHFEFVNKYIKPKNLKPSEQIESLKFEKTIVSENIFIQIKESKAIYENIFVITDAIHKDIFNFIEEKQNSIHGLSGIETGIEKFIEDSKSENCKPFCDRNNTTDNIYTNLSTIIDNLNLMKKDNLLKKNTFEELTKLTERTDNIRNITYIDSIQNINIEPIIIIGSSYRIQTDLLDIF